MRGFNHSKVLLLGSLLFFAPVSFACGGDDDSEATPPDSSKGGHAGSSAHHADGGGDSGSGGDDGSGGSGGSGSSNGSCEGTDGCYSCAKKTSDAQFLNQCTKSDSEAFDNDARIKFKLPSKKYWQQGDDLPEVP